MKAVNLCPNEQIRILNIRKFVKTVRLSGVEAVSPGNIGLKNALRLHSGRLKKSIFLPQICRKYISLTLSFLFLTVTTFAQGDKYTAAMKKAIASMNEALSTPGDNGRSGKLQEAANFFERIATKETDQWLPVYYEAYLNVVMSFDIAEEDSKDAHLDVAQELLDKAMALEGDKDEIMAVQGMLYIGRIVVKPMLRGMTYSGKVANAVEKSLEINADNPRAYYVLGMLYQGMPEFAGGGMGKACPEFNASKEKFATHQPKDEIHPSWGQTELGYWLGKCEG